MGGEFQMFVPKDVSAGKTMINEMNVAILQRTAEKMLSYVFFILSLLYDYTARVAGYEVNIKYHLTPARPDSLSGYGEIAIFPGSALALECEGNR